MILLLLPALVLMPFGGVSPRLGFRLCGPITQIPSPDPIRYAAYGQAFAVEMLLIDVATLWLVRRVSMRLAPSDRTGLRAGLLYLGLVFLSGALLQKFDLAAGALCLLAILALLQGQNRFAWIALALATLVKGYPCWRRQSSRSISLRNPANRVCEKRIRAQARELVEGIAWLASLLPCQRRLYGHTQAPTQFCTRLPISRGAAPKSRACMRTRSSCWDGYREWMSTPVSTPPISRVLSSRHLTI